MLVDHWQFNSWRTTQHLILTTSLIIHVLYQPKQVPVLFTNLDFSFPILNLGWKIFLLTIFTRYDFSVFLSDSFIGWEIFYQLIPYLVFFLSLLIIGLEDFSSATWPFKIHQLPYKARIFSVVFRFSFPVFLIGLRSFSLNYHFLSTIPRSMELASEERHNCNNVTLRMENFWSGSHVTTIIQNFILVSLTSTIMLHQVWLAFRVSGPLLDLYTWLSLLRTQLLFTLHTQRHTVYATELAGHLYTSWKDIPLGYLQIVYLSRHEAGSSSGVT